MNLTVDNRYNMYDFDGAKVSFRALSWPPEYNLISLCLLCLHHAEIRVDHQLMGGRQEPVPGHHISGDSRSGLCHVLCLLRRVSPGLGGAASIR